MTDWPGWKKQAAWEDMDGLVALGQLHNPERLGHLNGAQMYDVVLAATRSKTQALAAAKKRVDDLLAQEQGW